MAEGESSTKSGRPAHPTGERWRLIVKSQNMTDDAKGRGETGDITCSPAQDWYRNGLGNQDEASE